MRGGLYFGHVAGHVCIEPNQQTVWAAMTDSTSGMDIAGDEQVTRRLPARA